ncbi:MAG: LexA family protein [Patescibacteria group bacterium]
MRTKVHLVGQFSDTHVSRYTLPFYAEPVRAGFPSPAEDFIDGNLDLNDYLVQHPAATFFVRVSGNAMHRAGIVSGDILIVDRSLEPGDGKIIIAALDGELLVRRYKRVQNQVWLLADTRHDDAIVVTGDMHCEIWGVVTSVIHKT